MRLLHTTAFASAIVALALFSQSAWSAGGPSLNEIITTLEKQREQVRSLYIETKSYCATAIEPKVLRSSWLFRNTDFTFEDELHFAFKDGKRYRRMIQTTEMGKQPGTRHVRSFDSDEQAVDGKVYWERRVDLKLGPALVFVFDFDPQRQGIRNPGYCSNIGWDCKTKLNTQDKSALQLLRDHDLLTLLKSGAFAIDGLVDLAGVKCVVIRREYEARILRPDRSRPTLQATEKIWLDLEHGFTVRQRERDMQTYALHRIVNSDFVKILPGIWVPKKIESQFLNVPDLPKEYRSQAVLTYHTDLIRWSVNDVPDERFEVVTKPTDILTDSRTRHLGVRVIEAATGLEELATHSRDLSVSQGLPDTSKPTPMPLTDEAKSLVELLAKTAASASADADNLRVAIASGKGCDSPEPFVELLEKEMNCKCEIVTLTEIRAGALKEFDGVVFPGGQSRQQSAALGLEGRRAVREFVEAGGGYIGICAGGALATAGGKGRLGLINAKTLSGRRESPGPDGVMSVDMAKRHSGIVKMDLTDAGLKVLGGQPGLVDTKFALGPVFWATADKADKLGHFTPGQKPC